MKGSSTIHHKNLIHELLEKDQPYSKKKEDHVVLESEQNKTPQRGNFVSQVRAIFKKNLALQGKQRGTNICQVLSFDFAKLTNQDLDSDYLPRVYLPHQKLTWGQIESLRC